MGFIKLKIFYSWQTETDFKYNKNFINSCLEKAVRKLNNKPEFKGVDFVIQEGVKGEPGSPGVAAKISDERIPTCDIFIADLSVVNQSGWFGKFIEKQLYKKEFRPTQNSNVTIEYGIALNAVGVERIIGVLNNVYGSPNANPNNIPFDIRHMRFPVEYEYSSKTKNKEAAQKRLVDELATAIRDTALFALEHQRNKYSPLMVWQDWDKSLSIKETFVHNNKVDEIEALVKQSLLNPKLTVIILVFSQQQYDV